MKKFQLITVKEYIKNVPSKERKRRDGEKKDLSPDLKRFWEEWYVAKRENPDLKFSDWKVNWQVKNNKLNKEMEEIQEKTEKEKGNLFVAIIGIVIIVAIAFFLRKEKGSERLEEFNVRY